MLDGDHGRERHGDGEVGAPGQLRRQPPLLPRLVSDAVGSGEGSDSAEHDREEGGQTRAGAAVDAAKRRDRDMADHFSAAQSVARANTPESRAAAQYRDARRWTPQRGYRRGRPDPL